MRCRTDAVAEWRRAETLEQQTSYVRKAGELREKSKRQADNAMKIRKEATLEGGLMPAKPSGTKTVHIRPTLLPVNVGEEGGMLDRESHLQ